MSQGEVEWLSEFFEEARPAPTEEILKLQEVEHRERNQTHRDKYARCWSRFAMGQIALFYGLALMQGCHTKLEPTTGTVIDQGWHLEPEVMIALLGASSINSLGVVIAIAKGLFRSPE